MPGGERRPVEARARSARVVATGGLEFGPSCPVEDASCPSVISGRLYFPGVIIPGVGADVGPGLASRNALWAAMPEVVHLRRVGLP